ncbi:uncharacterized protein LOC120330759 [Styela clava]
MTTRKNSGIKYTLVKLGCWKDTGNRAIPSVDGILSKMYGSYRSRNDPIIKCADYSWNQGFEVFGVQDGGWCASSKTAEQTYQKYGPSNACKPDEEGGPWANEVYKMIAVTTTTVSTTPTLPETTSLRYVMTKHDNNENGTKLNSTLTALTSETDILKDGGRDELGSNSQTLQIALPIALVLVMFFVVLAFVIYCIRRRRKEMSDKSQSTMSGVTNDTYVSSPSDLEVNQDQSYEYVEENEYGIPDFYEAVTENSSPNRDNNKTSNFAGDSERQFYYSSVDSKPEQILDENTYEPFERESRVLSNIRLEKENILYGVRENESNPKRSPNINLALPGNVTNVRLSQDNILYEPTASTGPFYQNVAEDDIAKVEVANVLYSIGT